MRPRNSWIRWPVPRRQAAGDETHPRPDSSRKQAAGDVRPTFTPQSGIREMHPARNQVYAHLTLQQHARLPFSHGLPK